MKDDKLTLDDFKYVLLKLNRATIQQYVINLARRYEHLRGVSLSNVDKVKIGGDILDLFLIHGYLTKENTTDGTKSVTYLTPVLSDEDELFEQLKKEHTVLTSKPIFDCGTFTIGKRLYTFMLKESKVELSSSNNAVVSKLSSIPYELNLDYISKHRKPKSGVVDDNFTQSTKLFRMVARQNKDEDIYFFWQYDNRGRIYPKSWTVNPHGDEWQKVQIQFKNKEIVKEENLKWIERDIANHYGLDKESYETKDEWFRLNRDKILDLKPSIIDKADKRLLLQRSIKAYKEALDGKAIGLPVALDATSSSFQLMALLSRSKKIAEWTNLTSKTRDDVYIRLAEAYLKLKDQEITKDRLLRGRNFFKKPIMIYFYNGMHKIKEAIPNQAQRQEVLELVHEMLDDCVAVQDLINATYEEAKNLDYMEWYMPDGMKVSVPQIDHEVIKHQGKRFIATFRLDRVGPNYENNHRSLAPNLIHSIDAYVNRQMILKSSGDILPIHDSFQIHPNYCDEAISNYKSILNSISSDTQFLQRMLSNIAGKSICDPFKDKEPIVVTSDYCIC